MSVSRTIEIERKYTVGDSAVLPALDGLPGVVSAERRPVVHLDAVYVDTAERTLLAAGIAVRRRTGGHDAGWHVKLRGPAGRTELHAPIDDADPEAFPPPFEAALRSRLRGRALQPIARIRTERHAVIVRGAAGAAVEVVDDLVTATDLGAGVLRSWREWEAEQAADTGECSALLGRLHPVLLAAGATPSDSPAKIAQALDLPPTAARAPRPRTAGAVVAARLALHAEQLHRGIQALVLDGDPEGRIVHDLRRTIRRARSLLMLRTVAGPAGAGLRDGLGDLGRRLGAVRDPLVAAGIVERLLDGLDAGTPGIGDARSLLVDAPAREVAEGTARLVDDLGAPEVLAVIAAMEGFGPDGPAARRPAKALRALAERSVRQARRRARRAVAAGGAGDDLDALHRARKAAKRARFLVEELVGAGLIPPTAKLARAARADEAAQDVLGEHRDLALVLAALPAAAERLTAAGGNAYALGRIAEIGHRRLAALRRTATRAVRDLR